MKNYFRPCLALLIVLIWHCSCKQIITKNDGPLDVAKMIYAHQPSPDIHRHLTGDFATKDTLVPGAKDFPGATFKWKLLNELHDSLALVNMTVLLPDGKTTDYYLTMRKDTVWKLAAINSLAMTGMLQAELEELEQMPQGYLDTLIDAAQKDKAGNALKMLTSMDDYHFLIGNIKLVLQPDDSIVQHFLDNKQAFNQLKDSALAEMQRKPSDSKSEKPLLKNMEPAYKKLLIESVSTDTEDNGKNIDFTIGGIIDNWVGFLYVKDKKDLPDIYGGNLIMLRDIGDGWYLYKTT
ncbi:hypothetical protein [Chitinophaga sp. Cy-1792]|uniref:hypothetical protein n=1 Tax=Chitinophaga sp. Cy-1792 TaxID=2608339 RepID=UPI0014245A3B|nr:hypothetical protein [Chitinophaga sp. Cy-1792]NIG55143.1 hypothetical protein [Chitinophaga sp. Cy-1792]